jgi:hypothetical protein
MQLAPGHTQARRKTSEGNTNKGVQHRILPQRGHRIDFSSIRAVGSSDCTYTTRRSKVLCTSALDVWRSPRRFICTHLQRARCMRVQQGLQQPYHRHLRHVCIECVLQCTSGLRAARPVARLHAGGYKVFSMYMIWGWLLANLVGKSYVCMSRTHVRSITKRLVTGRPGFETTAVSSMMWQMWSLPYHPMPCA